MSDKEDSTQSSPSDHEEKKEVDKPTEEAQPNLFDDDDDELSDLDEDQFKDIDEDTVGLPISTDVFQKVQRHKRTKDETESSGPKKKRERTRTSRRSDGMASEKVSKKRESKKGERAEKKADDYGSLDPEART